MGWKSRPSTACRVKDRQVSGDDNADRVEDRPLYLVRGLANLLCRRERVLALVAEMPDDVFHHDDSTIDHHAEVQRAEREEVCRNVPEIETDGSKQESKRNGERDDESAANVAQKQEENDDNENDAFGEVMQHRMGCVVEQIASIEKGNDFDARRQDSIIQFVHFFVNAG